METISPPNDVAYVEDTAAFYSGLVVHPNGALLSPDVTHNVGFKIRGINVGFRVVLENRRIEDREMTHENWKLVDDLTTLLKASQALASTAELLLLRVSDNSCNGRVSG